MFDSQDPNTKAYTQMMYGVHAVHVPCWMFTQDSTEDIVSFIGASKSLDLRFGGQKEQRLVLGEIIVRPHFVIESDIYRGYGLGGLVTADKEEFIRAPDANVLLDPLEILKRRFSKDSK